MLRFGVLGAAAITPRALIFPCVDEPNAMIRVIAARNRERASQVAAWAGIKHVVDDYQAVIDHPDCNVIYIPLPITAHHEWTIKALDAGKHVLCEKSIAANGDEAQAMADHARDKGLVLIEAFHYRYHPVFERAKALLEQGAVGDIEHIDAGFCIKGPPRETDIRMLYETGGGATMDLGCYPISWVRHLLDAEPENVTAEATEGPPDVDLALSTEMEFASGITATTRSNMGPDGEFEMAFTVRGTEGSLHVRNPLVPQNGHSIELTRGAKTTVETRDRRSTYGYQLDAFIRAVEQGDKVPTDADDAVKQMRLIDRCYRAAGMRLRGEA